MSENHREVGSAVVPYRLPPVPEAKVLRRPSQIFRKMVPDRTGTARWYDIALVVSFSLAICLPLLGLVLHLDAGFSLEENRVLSTRPELTTDRSKLAEFPAKFEAYFNDQFGFRKRLIYWLNFTKVAALGVSPNPKVIFGSNGWMYYGDTDITYFRAITPLSSAQLVAWQQRLERRQSWLAARGIPYLIVIAPLKSTIYPEFMPRAYNRIGTVSRLDQLMAHLKAHSKLTVIDLRPAVADEKTRHQVFYRTDTHWNTRGSYVGYSKIIEALARWFPEIPSVPLSAFDDYHYSEQGRDLALILGMRPYFWDNYVDLRRIKEGLAHEVTPPPAGKLETRGPDIVFEHPDKRLPRCVMFRDSFANWLTPLLCESFSRVLYTWQYTLNREIVEREKPDVVIQEMVERVLLEQPPEP